MAFAALRAYSPSDGQFPMLALLFEPAAMLVNHNKSLARARLLMVANNLIESVTIVGAARTLPQAENMFHACNTSAVVTDAHHG